MFRMDTNGETDHLQYDLFVNISYKFTLAEVFVSYACTRITLNTCLGDKKIGTFYTDSVLYDELMPTYSMIISHDHLNNSHELHPK